MSVIFLSSTTLFTFLSWCIFTGGLSSMQYNCNNDGINANFIDGVSYRTSCKNVYRQSWFIMSYEIVMLLLVMLSIIFSQFWKKEGIYKRTQLSLVGLFSVALVLYIDSSNQLLNAEMLEYYKVGSQLNRIRTMTAGAIMTALSNALMIIVLSFGNNISFTSEVPASAV